MSGAKYLRVLNESMAISSDKDELKKEANYEILGVNAMQQASKQAKQGNTRHA